MYMVGTSHYLSFESSEGWGWLCDPTRLVTREASCAIVAEILNTVSLVLAKLIVRLWKPSVVSFQSLKAN